MWDLATIHAMNQETGDKAKNKSPYEVTSEEEIDEMPPFPFPSVGTESNRFDEEYERVTSLFVDSSGFGSPHEPALNSDQLKTELKELLEEHSTLLLAIESEGQFQLHLGVWKEKP